MLRNWRIRNHRICALHQQVLVRIPEIDVRFVILRAFLLLSLDRRQSFLYLIPRSGLLSRFATGQNCSECN